MGRAAGFDAGAVCAPATVNGRGAASTGPDHCQLLACRTPIRLPKGSSNWQSRSPVMIVFGPR
jgi:hypothetical protein